MAFRRKISNTLLAIASLGYIITDTPVAFHRYLSATDISEPVHDVVLANYSQAEIEATAPYLEVFHPRLFVWSEDEGFRVYNLDHKDSHLQSKSACGRCAKIVPLLVHALKSKFPNRFERGQPVFQLLWSDADSFQSVCVNKESNCHSDKFAPMPFFGSVPKDSSVLPTIKAFPNWFYINCLYNWKFGIGSASDCWDEKINDTIDWDALVPKVIWRGSDFTFLPTTNSYISPKGMLELVEGFGEEDVAPEVVFEKLYRNWHNLLPRWKAVTISAQAELTNNTWIDVKYVGPLRKKVHDKYLSLGIPIATSRPMEALEMSWYKYQIDIGGGGGKSVGLLMHFPWSSHLHLLHFVQQAQVGEEP